MNSDTVQIPTELAQASSEAWYNSPIQDDTDRLGNVTAAFRFAEQFLKDNADSSAAIQTTIERLRVADTNDEKVAALYIAARSEAILALLGAAVSRTRIVVPPQPDPPALPQILPYQYVQGNNDGCVAIDFPDEIVFLGANLNNDHIFANRLVPVVEAMSRLDVTKLIPMFERLLPILQAQTDSNRSVAELAEPIVEPRTRWAVHITVANYGASPFILFDNKGWLEVKCKDMKPFWLSAKLVYVPDGESARDVIGSHLVEAGKTHHLMWVTTQTQAEMPRGSRVRELWRSEDGRARVNFHVRGRELPFSIWGDSPWGDFKKWKRRVV